jgi:hypothetical protein
VVAGVAHFYLPHDAWSVDGLREVDMRIRKDTRTGVAAAAAAAALLLGAMAASDVGATPPYPNPVDVQKQWREVRARYPLVAAQYLELSAIAAVTQRELPCELQSLVNTNACRRQEDPECSPSPAPPPPPPFCQRCRPATGPADQQDYLECLEERIACLAP